MNEAADSTRLMDRLGFGFYPLADGFAALGTVAGIGIELRPKVGTVLSHRARSAIRHCVYVRARSDRLGALTSHRTSILA